MAQMKTPSRFPVFFMICMCAWIPSIIQGSKIDLDVVLYQVSAESAEKVYHYEPPKEIAQFSFAKHFQSHMVLQQAPQRANLYGFASPSTIGQAVNLEMVTSNEVFHYTTKISQGPSLDLGVWNVTLDPMKPQEPVIIRAYSGNDTLMLEDVLFGDVWLCSGQSNMQYPLSSIFGGAQEVASALKYPNIRFMNVLRQGSDIPRWDLIAVQQNWTSPTQTTVGGFSAVCWLYGKALYEALGYPIGLVGTNFGGTPVEAWSSPQALAQCGVNHTEERNYKDSSFSTMDLSLIGGPQNNSVLWNAMVYPLLGMTIYGTIWYQGEADSMTPEMMNRYNCTFPAMIDDWRLKFHTASGGQTSDMFPFGFVQLATSMPPQNPGFVDIRWHQTADHGYVPNIRLQNVFMAVAIDLPDFDSPSGPVHTRHKIEVGFRLGLSGLAVAYQKKEMFQGPFPLQFEFQQNGSLLLVDYGNLWTLDIRNTEGFEFLCTSGYHSKKTWWLPTSIIANDSTSVTLLATVCGQSEDVIGIRYLWQTTPCALKMCAVYSTVNQLPAPPFVLLGKENLYRK